MSVSRKVGTEVGHKGGASVYNWKRWDTTEEDFVPPGDGQNYEFETLGTRVLESGANQRKAQSE